MPNEPVPSHWRTRQPFLNPPAGLQFRGFDVNRDGVIDHDEFKGGLLSLGARLTEAQVCLNTLSY